MTNNVLNALKKNEKKSRAVINNYEIDENVLRQIQGGAASSGWVCTVSGECNGGSSCNPFKDILPSFNEQR